MQSRFNCVRLCDPTDLAVQACLMVGFSRQENWNKLPCPPLVDLPDPGIKPMSLMSPALAGGFYSTRATWEVPFLHYILPTDLLSYDLWLKRNIHESEKKNQEPWYPWDLPIKSFPRNEICFLNWPQCFIHGCLDTIWPLKPCYWTKLPCFDSISYFLPMHRPW